jgi:hypothetical protein
MAGLATSIQKVVKNLPKTYFYARHDEYAPIHDEGAFAVQSQITNQKSPIEVTPTPACYLKSTGPSFALLPDLRI